MAKKKKAQAPDSGNGDPLPRLVERLAEANPHDLFEALRGLDAATLDGLRAAIDNASTEKSEPAGEAREQWNEARELWSELNETEKQGAVCMMACLFAAPVDLLTGDRVTQLSFLGRILRRGLREEGMTVAEGNAVMRDAISRIIGRDMGPRELEKLDALVRAHAENRGGRGRTNAEWKSVGDREAELYTELGLMTGTEKAVSVRKTRKRARFKDLDRDKAAAAAFEWFQKLEAVEHE